jgi:hypothetical protein
VAAAFAALCADHIDAEVEALLDMLGVADHVHVEDAVLVEFLDDGFGRDTNGADEELGARVNNNVNELVKLALGVVVAVLSSAVRVLSRCACHLLGLACASTNLGKKQVDTKGRFLVVQVSLQLGDLLAQHVWCVADATQDTDASSICDGSSELRASSHVHTSQHDGVLDLEQISELCADLL